MRIVQRLLAEAAERIGHANGRDAIPHRYPVRARVGAKVRIEASILLHDHDDMLDLVDRRIDPIGGNTAGGAA
jgi:hypothetical protein